MIKEGTVILGIDPGTNILGFGIVRVGPDLRPQYVDMGVLDLRKVESPYEKLRIIHDKTGALCDLHHPAFLAIESPFYGKNPQVVLKLGRAQGAAITAALHRGIPVHEYAPRKAKIAITGSGSASKEQVCNMICHILSVDLQPEHLDATDAVAIALCHYYQLTNPVAGVKSSSDWTKFIEANPGRIKNDTGH